ncbi:MAG: iron-sulfur cluster insertion protein ErpA [Bdellovibrionales bacterium]|nr:iron-sulfur cluster insertion protein ErpA [Bdellovibrionales bacterium]
MIQVTDTAAQQISKLKQEDSKLPPESFLRVKVVTGGCSGMSYKLDFETQQQPDDKVVEHNGVKLVIDKKSFLYLVGMNLDYQGGLNGQGFVFNNPNATRTCGCGSSFGV